ncbi:hypothetical protein SAMN05421800_1185 [Chryseobacterium balustinum]|uniref:Uncharacterized protein n=1 Tax=Chryseobacterium balustinum TaxID=246 RepID=A0AAX2IIU3_9FLAO|nr:hypothetical protein SAMN05421800_1185 [Chryseobacterium balustinum]SQA88892.1 Uncharacterised protein [Chryseobacterium balustinum]
MFANTVKLLKFTKDVVSFKYKNLLSEQVFVLMYVSVAIKYYGIFKVNRFSDVS